MPKLIKMNEYEILTKFKGPSHQKMKPRSIFVYAYVINVLDEALADLKRHTVNSSEVVSSGGRGCTAAQVRL